MGAPGDRRLHSADRSGSGTSFEVEDASIPARSRYAHNYKGYTF